MTDPLRPPDTDEEPWAPPTDFGQQLGGWEDPHPWVLPILGGLAFGAVLLAIITRSAS